MVNWSIRQPKIYIKLPSQGNFWPEGSLEKTPTGEYPVYSMSIADEISTRIPDGLINGVATVNIIESCIPNIKNAWSTPSIDLDLILIAIRIATYGEKMLLPLDTKDADVEFDVDLRNIMNNLVSTIKWDPLVPVNDIIVHVKPVSYQDFNKDSIETFESQKSIQIIEKSDMSEEEKLKILDEIIKKISIIPIDFISKSIECIETPYGIVDDTDFIREFVENIDKETFEKIKSHVESLQENNKIPPVIVNPNQAMLDAGYEDVPIEVPLSFDQSFIFRLRLLMLDMDQIDSLAKSMEKEVRSIKDEMLKFCWYMRGSITVSEAYNLTFEDREIIGKIIEGNLETTKKSGLPFF